MNAPKAVDVQVVYVGQNPVNNATAPKYWPEKITAAPGTMVQFQFWAGNHTITQSSFDAPCVPLAPNTTAGANSSAPIKSGFQPVSASAGEGGAVPIYTIMINDTKPVWLYCGQAQHCANGMSLVINEKYVKHPLIYCLFLFFSFLFANLTVQHCFWKHPRGIQADRVHLGSRRRQQWRRDSHPWRRRRDSLWRQRPERRRR
jgi:plastocyanin